ncbi:MAG: hypothetical protein IJZ21_03200, partial [Clostridia bacterium]|nr:hypothetical protein [Clostridia bacterium]
CKIERCEIKSESGGTLKLRYEGIGSVAVTCDGKSVETQRDGFYVTFETQKGATYKLDGFSLVKKREIVTELTSGWTDSGVALKWNSSQTHQYEIYRAKDNESDYTLLAVTDNCEFIDSAYSSANRARLTYKIVVSEGSEHSSSADGALTVLHPASELEEERYKLLFKVINKLD